MKPRLYADFQNLDDDGHVRLNTQGTFHDLSRLGLTLTEGTALILYTDDADETGRPDDLLVDGLVRRTADGGWVAEVDWDSLRHASDEVRLDGDPGTTNPARKSI
ncbi:MAG TPA: hypothetical protein VKD90_21555 [Gemmataceae bacterium]|nr:hypothetical protein [Gemmataceae bacterium]